MAEHVSKDFLVSTKEVAEILNEAFDSGRETPANVARRTGLHPRAIFRVKRAQTVGTTSRVAETLLEAVGASLSDIPSYYDDTWRQEQQKSTYKARGVTHGRKYAYRLGCRCEVCVEAHQGRIKARQQERALERALSMPMTQIPIQTRRKYARVIHTHPVIDPVRGIAV
jgi:hypothetical protein